MESDETRHSVRPRKLPAHLKDYDLSTGSHPPGNPDHQDSDARSLVSHRSSRSAASDRRRLKREAELAAKAELLALEEDESKLRLQRKKEFLKLKLEKQLEDIEEDFLSADEDGREVVKSNPNVQPVKVALEVPVSVPAVTTQEWINKAPSNPESPRSQQSPASSNEPCSTPPSSGNSKAKSEAVQIGEAMGEAFAKKLESLTLKPQNRDISEKLLARQSHAKDLPEFNGKPEQWLTFLSSFERSTRVCGFTDEENILRLRKCLKGDALSQVEILLSNPENLTKIISRLQTRFGQKKHIIRALILKAQEAPKVRDNDIESIILFGQHVLNLVEVLKSFKAEAHLSNPQLLEDITGKLPPSMQIQWMEQVSPREEANLLHFSSWIDRKVEIACSLSPPTKFESGNSKKKCAVLTTEEKSQLPSKKKCLFCEHESHKIQQCRKFEKKDGNSRFKIAKEKNLCFCCLNFGHGTKDCRSKKRCEETECTSFHHPLLHKQKESDKDLKEESKENADEQQLHVASHVVYQVLPVILQGPKKEIRTHALLDSGSAYTLLDCEISDALGLRGRNQTLGFTTIGKNQQSVPSQTVSLTIVNPRNKKSFQLENVKTFPELRLSGGTVTNHQFHKWEHLRNLPLPIYTDAKPMVLIGLQHAHLITPTKVVTGPKNAPIAAETPLGWAVFGKLGIPEDAEVVQHMNSILKIGEDRLHQLVKSYFTTEEFGVRPTSKTLLSREEERADLMAKKSLRRIGDRFEVALLWREDNVTLPESRIAALKRLYSVERKLDKDPVYAERYCRNVEHYIKSGYLVKLTPEEVKHTTKKTWYLPHFGVTNPKKPEKLRLVFDAAAMSNGVSLNSRLLSGSDILKPLPSVLSKFRERKIAISADIKEMFHQVHMHPDDQESQRLLWRGMDRNTPVSEYKMTVMTFGATCSPFCAQLVKNENAKEFQDQFPRAAESVSNRHYVDDFLDSCDTEEEAFKLFKEVFQIQAKGGFHLCNWVSNNPNLIRKIPEELRSKSQKSFSGRDLMNSERVLGLVWNPYDDNFSFDSRFCKVSKDVLCGTKSPSKREALSLIMSVFDPLGFCSVLTVKAKILLQKAWRSGIGWDDLLPDSLFAKWKEWITELQEITKFKIPRCYSAKFSCSRNLELHVFCDASELAFAAVAYFRMETGETAFVAAKTRVTPLKAMTIPRYELQAAVMGVRLAQSILEWHDVKPTRQFFWTDSRTVICWLTMDNGQLKPFVSHRVGEIQESSDTKDWRWILTHENVADEATRDTQPCDFTPSSRWLNGPEFLKKPHCEWPITSEKDSVDPEILEIKKEFLGSVEENKQSETDCPIDFHRFRRWNVLVRATARVFRAIAAFHKKKILFSSLQIDELEKAEKQLWKWSQRQDYGDEIDALSQPSRKKAQNVLKRSRLSKLSIFLDSEGILRMKGRVQANVVIGNLVRNPVILDSKNPYTTILIRHHHERAGNHGRDRVINELKQLYCIPKLREAVKKVWRECQHCKNARAQPELPEMAPLPKARLESYQRPFTQTGVDYFGPMEITCGRRHEKRYGALFTCLVTRAVHLELAGSLSTDSFIMALRRFIARRGNPKDIYSDNGTNFVGADNELRVAIHGLDQAKLAEELGLRHIQWHFIPPQAPHMGGSWERMVKAVKVSLMATLKERSPREETLLTLLAEAENTVNGHPLTYVDSDPESQEVLTPNHFLLGSPNNFHPPGQFTDRDLLLGKQWRLAQRLSDHFWSRWIKEFLPTLRQRQKWIDRKKPMEVGDIVIIADSALPRNSWPKGIIVDVPDTVDGQTRWATVKTAIGTFKRPASKICILDVKQQSP